MRQRRAFAVAWKELSGRYAGVHGESYEQARERLARIVVTLGKGPIEDAQLIALAIAAFERR
jgi:hypothetical protein